MRHRSPRCAEALTAGADLILLDNMTTAQIRAAVGLARSCSAKLEASGGLIVHHAAEIAATGVDYVSVDARSPTPQKRWTSASISTETEANTRPQPAPPHPRRQNEANP